MLPPSMPSTDPFRSPAIAASVAGLGVALLVFAASLFGIFTRPVGFLAAFWPANAILLGTMVRYPAAARPVCWFGAALGFVAADLATGGKPIITAWLTAANLAGVGAGFGIFRLLSPADRRLERPISVLYLLAASLAGAAVAALTGGGLAKAIFNRDMLDGFMFWFTTELVNYVIMLPVILTSPSRSTIRTTAAAFAESRFKDLLPALALIASIGLSAVVGGPGAFAYPVPALLWCALSYGLFSTAVATLMFSVWDMVAVSAGLLHFSMEGDPLLGTASERLAIALIALGPISVASIGMARNNLVRALHHAASHDFLTSALSRGAFMRSAQELLARPARRDCFALMLDIDHFKSVNDRYGHATGDRALVAFAKTVTARLRPGDIFGRLGGEEFALILKARTQADALAFANAIRMDIEALEVPDDSGAAIRITVSGGLTTCGDVEAGIDTVLQRADKALYAAKGSGRNRVLAAGSEPEVAIPVRQAV